MAPTITITATTMMKRNQENGGAPGSAAPSKPKEPKKPDRGIRLVAGILNGVFPQTVLYMCFVYVFQMLTGCFRMPQEFLLDKHVMDRIIENHFDSSHNTFESVRRVADIWEWGNTVLWPGLFGDMGPCQGYTGSRDVSKTCVDDVWPDGEGSFHMEGATPYGIHELLKRMDEFDWTEGITIRQTRALPGDCPGLDQLGQCFPELPENGVGDSTSYGHNITHPSSPLDQPFGFYTSEQLGADPLGMVSAAIPSMRTYSTSGFIAFVQPFFSDTFYPYEEGTASEVADYRDHYVNTTNGREAKFYCIRTSTNGHFIRQMCDPGANGDGTGRLTGAVRRHVEIFWNDLKRSHFIDSQTRVVALFMQLKSNYVGVRMRYTLMFELTPLGAILPSYDVESRVLDARSMDDMLMYASIAFGLVCGFCGLEFVEAYYEGLGKYLRDVWNVMDWANFIIYFMVYDRVLAVQYAIDPANRDCSSYLCAEAGIFDDWKTMKTYRQAKLYLSLCVCIQLFKILKFSAQLIPRTGLATSVLRKCALDLFFFMITFVISMLAFSMMLYVQLGPVMEGYMNQDDAFITLFRGLFGDFDIDEIMDNSSGYLNAMLFLVYLFVAIFIMLSMFLAILAESQVAVRDDESQMMNDPEFIARGGPNGVFTLAMNQLTKLWAYVSPKNTRSSAVAEAESATTGGSETEADVAPSAAKSADNAAILAAIAGLKAEVGQLRAELAARPAAPEEVIPSFAL